MKKIIILIIMAIFCLSIVNAEDFYFKKGNNVNITTPCFNSGEICSNETYCTISITDPSGNIVVDNQNMTYGVVIHTYNYTPSLLGTYDVLTYCDDNGETGYGSFNFQSNNIGRQISNFGIYTFILFCLFILCMIVLIMLIMSQSPMMYGQSILSSLIFMILTFYLYTNSLIFENILRFFWLSSMVLFSGLFFITLWFYMIALISTWGTRGKAKKHFKDKF